MNKVMYTGRLVDEMRFNTLDDGTEVANGTIAVQRNFKNSQGNYDSDFIDFEAWKGRAPLMHQYIKKGDFFGITGRTKTKIVERDGKKTKQDTCVVEDFDFPIKPKQSNGQQNQQQNQQQSDGTTPMDLSDDQLPFDM